MQRNSLPQVEKVKQSICYKLSKRILFKTHRHLKDWLVIYLVQFRDVLIFSIGLCTKFMKSKKS